MADLGRGDIEGERPGYSSHASHDAGKRHRLDEAPLGTDTQQRCRLTALRDGANLQSPSGAREKPSEKTDARDKGNEGSEPDQVYPHVTDRQLLEGGHFVGKITRIDAEPAPLQPQHDGRYAEARQQRANVPAPCRPAAVAQRSEGDAVDDNPRQSGRQNGDGAGEPET